MCWFWRRACSRGRCPQGHRKGVDAGVFHQSGDAGTPTTAVPLLVGPHREYQVVARDANRLLMDKRNYARITLATKEILVPGCQRSLETGPLALFENRPP